MQGQCVADPAAPTGTCLFEDGYATGATGTYAMTCEDALNSRSVAQRKTLKTVCQDVGENCCSTCKSE